MYPRETLNAMQSQVKIKRIIYQGHSCVQWQYHSVGSGIWPHSLCASAGCASSWYRSAWNGRGRYSTHMAFHLQNRKKIQWGISLNLDVSCASITRRISLAWMCPHVSFQLVSISAGIAAQAALEGPLSCMRADVPFQLAHLWRDT